MPKATVQTADGPKTLTFPEGTTKEQIGDTIDELFTSGKLKKGFSQPKSAYTSYVDRQVAAQKERETGGPKPALKPSDEGNILQRGLREVFGHELGNRIVGEAPMAGAMIATAAMPPAAGALQAGALFGATKGLIEKALGSGKTPRQAASDFVWDTTIVAGSQKLLEGVAKLGGQVFDRFVLNAAAKAKDMGRTVETAESAAHGDVQQSVVNRGNVTSDVTAAYKKYVKAMNDLPKGGGKVGHVYGELQGVAKKLYDTVSADLAQVEDATGLPRPATQKLDALIRLESKWMEEAYKATGGDKSEQAARVAMKNLADDIRAVIVKDLTPAERKMFEYAKGLTSARFEATAAMEMAKRGVGGLIKSTLKDVYDIAGAPLVDKYAPIVLEQMIGSGPSLSLLRGATSRISNHPELLAQAIEQTGTALSRYIPAELKEAIQREAAKVAAKAKEAANAAPQGQE